jgi:peptide/nickel transport system substrate-binding protein
MHVRGVLRKTIHPESERLGRGAPAALLALAGFLLVGCSGARVREIRIAHESDVASLDPTAFPEVATWSILGNIYEGLVTFDKDMRLVPALAESWSTPDDQTWVFELQKDVRFHDGRILTAADVKFSVDRARDDPASGMRGYLTTLERTEAMGPTTFRLHVTRPDPLVLNRLANVLVVPAGVADVAKRPIGTGPYRFVGWKKGKSLEAQAYEGYRKGRPSIDHVRFIPVEKDETALDLLRTGSVDILRWVPEGQVDRFRALPGFKVVARKGLAAYYLWFNSRPQGADGRANPFADRRVRQAVSLAIDRQELAKRLGGQAAPLRQLVHDSVVGYTPELPPLSFIPDDARRLVQEAGYAGTHVKLTHRPQPSLEIVGQAVREMLERVQIHVDLETLEWNQMLTAMKGSLPFYLAGWDFDGADAWSFLRDCLFSRDPSTGYGAYNPGYSNPSVDRLIDEHDRIFDGAKRRQDADHLMRLLHEDMPLVPLYIPNNLYAVSDRVQWKPRLDGSLFAADMTLDR